jgi:uncharacterized protein with GYD domain
MSTFVLMTKLSPEVTHDMKKRETVGKAWKARVKGKCKGVKFQTHFALLGPYDFMDIYEAPNEETAAKVAMITLSMGALKAETWPAIPYSRFLKLAKEV